MDEFYDEYDNSILHNAWWVLPDLIDWLIKKRQLKKSPSYGINLTIILQTACLIEGFLYELISTEIGTPVYKKSLNDRLLIDLNLRLENASWILYQDLFKIVFAKKISDYTTNHNWKAINMLFNLRNMLTHGKTVELKFYDDKQLEPIFTGKYSNLYSYYKEVKLIDVKSKAFIAGNVDFVSMESADYFYQEGKFLLEQLYLKIGNTNEQIATSYEMAFSHKTF